MWSDSENSCPKNRSSYGSARQASSLELPFSNFLYKLNDPAPQHCSGTYWTYSHTTRYRSHRFQLGDGLMRGCVSVECNAPWCSVFPYCFAEEVLIHYTEAGLGFPLLLIPGGRLNSKVAELETHPFNPMAELAGEYNCIAADLLNASDGQSTGPLESTGHGSPTPMITRSHGSSRHREVCRAGILYRWPLHLEPCSRVGTRSRWCGRARSGCARQTS
jgi:hypothetical protein